MNGHEVSKASGIPPSKIYETLQRLEAKGAVLKTRSEPVQYTASPHTKLMSALRQRFETDLATAETGLSELPTSRPNGLIWSLRTTESVISAFCDTIDNATSEIHAALWDAELEHVAPSLERASRRGIQVHVAIYGKHTLDGPVCYDLTLCGESALKRLNGRRLSAIVADQTKTVIAEFHTDNSVEALTTDSPLMSLLTVEYIKGDVLGRLLINQMGQDHFEHIRQTSPSMRTLLDPVTKGKTTPKAQTKQ